MVDCEFSEFSYGYAVVREAESTLARVYRSAGAPVLPSLVQEEALGWDAHLRYAEYALFLQFKRTEYVSRRNPASPSWPLFGMPHFRFSIDTDGHQHQALIDLEQRLSARDQIGEVFYASPRFHTQDEFDDAYSAGAILDRSLIVAPSEFGVGSGRHHYATGPFGQSFVLSEPRQPERPDSWEGLIAGVRERASTAQTRQRRVSLAELEEDLAVVVDTYQPRRMRDRDAPATRRLDRLAMNLGCGLILLTYDESADEPEARL